MPRQQSAPRAADIAAQEDAFAELEELRRRIDQLEETVYTLQQEAERAREASADASESVGTATSAAAPETPDDPTGFDASDAMPDTAEPLFLR